MNDIASHLFLPSPFLSTYIIELSFNLKYSCASSDGKLEDKNYANGKRSADSSNLDYILGFPSNMQLHTLN